MTVFLRYNDLRIRIGIQHDGGDHGMIGRKRKRMDLCERIKNLAVIMEFEVCTHHI